MPASLLAVSDLHVAYDENRSVVDAIMPETDDDWLIVAGDVGERFDDIEATLSLLRGRFRRVIWTPGNHELWTHPGDAVQLRGQARYEALVRLCRELDVVTPEDDYPVWSAPDGPVVVVPLFALYDYSFRVPGADTKEESLRRAHDAGVVCTDEFLLHPDPYPDRESWCRARVAVTEERLAAIDPTLPTVLVSHWPLVRQPTAALWYPEFAQWCGTDLTARWHTRFRAVAAVYGHLHIPRSTTYDGVAFEEVSLGYPREWGRRSRAPAPVRRILGGLP
ncbi:metallophosphoesterase family protein [Myceligenerans pegani]|uniref:Metallophosphoesterase n=1 Tax=Myceligenerans pegani TaxID=2776917 RepID=A0ABR9MZG7_9MICO|nr:metallophosphoesterase [Myceligenerans sp. TRM 65318]MBE1876187.1 metallophosphoesterase [Myceligenerans sp. TRM 65318]MBE3018458.1 metallophosphoesterase [Myceligenerans sp. TRM 65318]